MSNLNLWLPYEPPARWLTWLDRPVTWLNRHPRTANRVEGAVLWAADHAPLQRLDDALRRVLSKMLAAEGNPYVELRQGGAAGGWCRDELSVGPEDDLYLTACDDQRGHEGPHEGEDPNGDRDRWRWVKDASGLRFWTEPDHLPDLWAEAVERELRRWVTNPGECDELVRDMDQGNVMVSKLGDESLIYVVANMRTGKCYTVAP